jgi:hypothetical protein
MPAVRRQILVICSSFSKETGRFFTDVEQQSVHAAHGGQRSKIAYRPKKKKQHQSHASDI